MHCFIGHPTQIIISQALEEEAEKQPEIVKGKHL
jgi:hypothetical protein